jgi:hypothetical protein
MKFTPFLYYNIFLSLSILLWYMDSPESEGSSKYQFTKIHGITAEETVILFIAVLVRIL